MTLLEVEQKFSWKLEKFSTLISSRGCPRFMSAPIIQSRTFRDIYYDSDNKLSSKGLWLRKRLHYSPYASMSTTNAEVWEAKKVTPGSSFTRSTYEETQDTNRILQMVSAHIPGCLGPEAHFGLRELCRLETLRRSLLAGHKFTVVLDETDLGHSIGEVELLAEDAEEAHADIGAFINRYEGFFNCSEPKGKLTAYFEKYPFAN